MKHCCSCGNAEFLKPSGQCHWCTEAFKDELSTLLDSREAAGMLGNIPLCTQIEAKIMELTGLSDLTTLIPD